MKIKILASVMSVALLASLALTACGASETETEVQELSVYGSDYIDLTNMSSVMVYAEVFNMLNNPYDYKDKTVKMEGTLSSFYDEEANKTRYACIITDATACCSEGIEFKLDDSYNDKISAYKDGETVTVEGTFAVNTSTIARYPELVDSVLI